MLSLAAAWITATVFKLLCATVYWGNCSQSKMPLLVWLPTHGNSTTLHCAICIGFRSVNELYSKPPCCMVYNLLRGLAPSYLRDFCRPVSILTGRLQRSGTTGFLHVSRTKTSIGSRRFAVAGPVNHMEQFTCWAVNTRTVFSVFYQAFEDLSLQQLFTLACIFCIVFICTKPHRQFSRKNEIYAVSGMCQENAIITKTPTHVLK